MLSLIIKKFYLNKVLINYKENVCYKKNELLFYKYGKEFYIPLWINIQYKILSIEHAIMTEDREAQDDELLALAGIYEPDVSKTEEEEGELPGGSFECILDVPKPLKVIIKESGCVLLSFMCRSRSIWSKNVHT